MISPEPGRRLSLGQRHRVFGLHLVQHRRQIRRRERLAAGEHVIEHRSRREDVGPVIDFRAARLLGRHEVGRADDEAARRHVRVGEPRHAEVEDLQAPVVLDEDVAGLDVAMEDAVHVRDGEPFAHLAHEIERRLERRATGRASGSR